MGFVEMFVLLFFMFIFIDNYIGIVIYRFC